MTQEPEEHEREAGKRPRVSRWAVLRSVGGAVTGCVVLATIVGSLLALLHPETPLPDAWNPIAPLAITDLVTPLTAWKVRRTQRDPVQCLSVLQGAARASRLPPLEESEACHIRNRVSLSGVGSAQVDPVETSCGTALRLALWEHHGVQPAAREILGARVTILRQVGSYNCRPIRTSRGASNRWSTHATADAIDITGFDFADGRRIRLLQDWNGTPEHARFLRAVRDSACTWFATALGPDYNALHADHFHLQSRGWGTCR